MLENIDGIVTKDDVYRLLSHATTGTPDNGVIINPTQLASLCALVRALPSKDYEPVRHGYLDNGRCSVCFTEVDYFVGGDSHYVDEEPIFCPRCGAMIGCEVDDE